MSTARKELVWSIKKQLFRLASDDIYQLAKDVAVDNPQGEVLDLNDEERCIEYVISYMHSDTLLKLEDEGMSQLLALNDLICRISHVGVPSNVSVGASMGNSIPDENHHSSCTVPNIESQPHSPFEHTHTQSQPYPNTHSVATGQSVQELRHLCEELSDKLRQCEPTVTQATTTYPRQTGGGQFHPSHHAERAVSLRDLSYLQRRDFKVHGGQVGDQNSDLSYNNISKQIDEGIKEGFAEAEVVRGVLRIIKPGAFRDMLVNKDSVTISELKGFLRSHLGEKATTEMFQELMCAKQADQESPQQFLYRMIGLKQKLIFQSRQASSDISYDPKTIQEVFLHTIYQGLGAKHADLRQRLRPLTSNSQVTDEEILRQVMKIINEENEHQRRLGQNPRQKTTQVHSAKVETGGDFHTDNPRETKTDSKNSQTIQQLSAQVEALTHMVATLVEQQTKNNSLPHRPATPAHNLLNPRSHLSSNIFTQPQLRQPQDQVRGRPPRCVKCSEQDILECSHCFVCGEMGHRAVGCLKRGKMQGNGARPLRRDTQRPTDTFSPKQ